MVSARSWSGMSVWLVVCGACPLWLMLEVSVYLMQVGWWKQTGFSCSKDWLMGRPGYTRYARVLSDNRRSHEERVTWRSNPAPPACIGPVARFSLTYSSRLSARRKSQLPIELRALLQVYFLFRPVSFSSKKSLTMVSISEIEDSSGDGRRRYDVNKR